MNGCIRSRTLWPAHMSDCAQPLSRNSRLVHCFRAFQLTPDWTIDRCKPLLSAAESVGLVRLQIAPWRLVHRACHPPRHSWVTRACCFYCGIGLKEFAHLAEAEPRFGILHSLRLRCRRPARQRPLPCPLPLLPRVQRLAQHIKHTCQHTYVHVSIRANQPADLLTLIQSGVPVGNGDSNRPLSPDASFNCCACTRALRSQRDRARLKRASPPRPS